MNKTNEGTAFVWTKTFKEGFQRFTKSSGADLQIYMTEIMRTLVETCYGYCPPPTKGNTGGKGGKKGGTKSVHHDTQRVTEGRSDNYLTMLEQRFGSFISIATLKKKGTSVPYTLTNITLNRGDPQALSSFHQQNRNQQTGRVNKPKREPDSINDRSLAPENTVATLKKDAVAKVGKQKAGWETALNKTGSTKFPHSWSRKAGHLSNPSGAGNGSYTEALNIGSWSGYLEAINDVPYGTSNYVPRATRETEKMLTNARRFERWTDQMIKKHSEVR